MSDLKRSRWFRAQWACSLALGAWLTLPGHAKATTVSTIPVLALPGLEAVGDEAVSTIIRDTNGVTVTVHTTLAPGPHTLWILIWNDPSRCLTTPCTPPPAGGSDPPDSVLYAGGNLIISSGRADYAARVEVGDTDDVISGAEQLGLTNPMGAEVHAVLRSKGPVIPDRLELLDRVALRLSIVP